jgi:putative phosphoribosyl transferase
VNRPLVEYLGISDRAIDNIAASEQRELERRERAYRDDRPPVELRDKTIILIDDGLATGSTMRAAIAALKQQQPERIVVGVPVAPASTCEELRKEVDEVVCPLTPEVFDGVGRWYEDFSQTSDDEVRALLEQSHYQAVHA